MSKSKKPNERRIWTIEERLGFIDRNGLPHLIQGGNQIRNGDIYAILEGGIPEIITHERYIFGGQILKIPKFKGNREFNGWTDVKLNPYYTDEFYRYVIRSLSKSAAEDMGIKEKDALKAVKKVFSYRVVLHERGGKKVKGYLSNQEMIDIHQFYSPQADITAHFLMASDKLFR